ncbi:hypothetical protein M3Y96_00137500 [Aphelenchoides besseyi]|nr:hypothetical protein M3Y96_00137500 [Aphelenchoides besseyi]
MPYVILSMLIIPLFAVSNLFVSRCYFLPAMRDYYLTYRLECEPIVETFNYRIAQMFVGLIVAVPTLFFNAATFFRLAAETSATVRKNMDKHQVNFAVICLSRFISDVAFVAYSFLSYLLSKDDITDTPLRNVHFYFYTANDLLTLTPGVIILLSASKLREAVFGQKIVKFYRSKIIDIYEKNCWTMCWS